MKHRRLTRKQFEKLILKQNKSIEDDLRLIEYAIDDKTFMNRLRKLVETGRRKYN